MKIQKGKLSNSNAVVIGVLVVVLYCVIPSGSQRKRQNSGVPAEQTAQIPGESKPTPGVATEQQQSGGLNSNTSPAVIKDKPAEINLRAVEEIDEVLLTALSDCSPFRTKVIAKNWGNGPEETNAKATEVGDVQQDTLEAQKYVRSAKISLIYSSSTGKKAAIVNDEIVYPGSRISDNYLVETVQPDGLGLRAGTVPFSQSP